MKDIKHTIVYKRLMKSRVFNEDIKPEIIDYVNDIDITIINIDGINMASIDGRDKISIPYLSNEITGLKYSITSRILTHIYKTTNEWKLLVIDDWKNAIGNIQKTNDNVSKVSKSISEYMVSLIGDKVEQSSQNTVTHIDLEETVQMALNLISDDYGYDIKFLKIDTEKLKKLSLMKAKMKLISQ